MSRKDRIKTTVKIVEEHYERTKEPIEAFNLIKRVMATEKVTRETALDYITVARDNGEIRFVNGYAYAPGGGPPEVNEKMGVTKDPQTKTAPQMLADHENRLRRIEKAMKAQGVKLI